MLRGASQLPYLHFASLLAETCPRHPVIMLESRHVSMRLHAQVRRTVCLREESTANHCLRMTIDLTQKCNVNFFCVCPALAHIFKLIELL